MVKFTKMVGNGNDFIIIDNMGKKYSTPQLKNMARQYCKRSLSVGGDGLLAVEADQDCDFRMRFFTPDGNQGEMCGNGILCLARWYKEKKESSDKRSFSIQTNSGVLQAEVIDSGMVRMSMPPAGELEEKEMDFDEKKYQVYHLWVGVPHTVVFMDNVFDLDAEKIKDLGKKIRLHPEFEKGTNVNFVEEKEEEIRVRTYERGVEEETLASGTGSTASAFVLNWLGKKDFPIKVRTRGGVLEIEKKDGLFLKGFCEMVAEGIILQKPDKSKT